MLRVGRFLIRGQLTQELPNVDPLIPSCGLSVLVVEVDGIQQFSVDVELLVERSSVAYSDRLAAPVPVKMREIDFGNVCFASDSKHDGKAAIGAAGLQDALADELHVSIGLFLEAEPQQDVHREARVPHP